MQLVLALEPEQVESAQLAQQYETSLLSDQAVHDAADLSDGAAAATLLANRAEARRQMSECQACVADCDRALMFDPTHVKATVRRALANEYLEKYDRAARDFETASRLDPGNAIAREGSRRVAPFL